MRGSSSLIRPSSISAPMDVIRSRQDPHQDMRRESKMNAQIPIPLIPRFKSEHWSRMNRTTRLFALCYPVFIFPAYSNVVEILLPAAIVIDPGFKVMIPYCVLSFLRALSLTGSIPVGLGVEHSPPARVSLSCF